MERWGEGECGEGRRHELEHQDGFAVHERVCVCVCERERENNLKYHRGRIKISCDKDG